MVRTAILSFLLVSIAGFCADDASPWEGRLVPRDFTALCAPQNTLSLPGWRSVSTSIQLIDIQPENKRVKSGETIAVFAFTQEDAKEALDQRLSKIRAQNEEKLIKLKKTIRDLEAELDRRRITAQTSALDLVHGSSISKIRQATLEFSSQQQEFERKAQAHKLKAARENFASVEAICKNQIDVWTRYYEMYNHTKKRYTIVAPEDGYLFYPHIDKKKRKVQKGDDLNSGIHFLSVVKSDRSQLLFFLPEKELFRVKPGDEVLIFLDAQEIPASVTDVGFFPQRIGDVKDDYKLPDAWEKCFLVKADVLKPLSVGANSNVRVGPKK